MKNSTTRHDLEAFSQHPAAFPHPGQIASYDSKLKVVGNYDETTLRLFGALEGAYNYFRKELFFNRLTPVVLTLNRNARSMGYYMPHAWLNDAKEHIPEINISPSVLRLPAIEVMQTLVHEMCHHFQQLYGHPGKGGYHNVEFSKIMFPVGLMCSNTGLPGGAITGRHMGDYVVENGTFINSFDAMPREYLLPFRPFLYNDAATTTLSADNSNDVKKNKVKYTCAECRINVWGRPDLNIICGVCRKQLISINKI